MNAKQLALYLGCRCQTPKGILILSSVSIKSRFKGWFTTDFKENQKALNQMGLCGRAFYLTEIKPILRPLSSMTEEEAVEWMIIGDKYMKKKYWVLIQQ
jgi:hypothetical protein